MADEEAGLTDKELKERWETPEGQAFREEIIRQLQSEETGHAVDWENLKVTVGGEDKCWRDFPGVNEIRNKYDDQTIEIAKDISGLESGMNLCWGDLRFIELVDIEIPYTVLNNLNFSNAILYEANLKKTNLNWANLEKTTLDGAKLQNSKLYQASLKEASLILTNLENAYLKGAKLIGCFLYDANLKKTNLEDAKLQNSFLIGTLLNNAKLRRANLENAKLQYVQLTKTDLRNTNLKYTKIENSNLQNANINLAVFSLKSFLWRIGLFNLLKKLGVNIDSYRPTIFKGADLTGIKLGSSPTMHRKLLDEVYLEDFAEHHKYLYYFWLWTSNCGRSPALVFLWSIILGCMFGFAFAHYPYPSFLPDWAWLQSVLVIDKPMFIFDGPEWWRPFYHSFTTLTTLGWASANPNSTAGFWWHTAENILGYVMLGYLIAVIGDLLTRRSN